MFIVRTEIKTIISLKKIKFKLVVNTLPIKSLTKWNMHCKVDSKYTRLYEQATITQTQKTQNANKKDKITVLMMNVYMIQVNNSLTQYYITFLLACYLSLMSQLDLKVAYRNKFRLDLNFLRWYILGCYQCVINERTLTHPPGLIKPAFWPSTLASKTI